MMMTTTTGVAYLDFLDPAFRPDSPQVHAAREARWFARTPTGFAVLRHDKQSILLTDRRLRQGTHRVLAAQGIIEGPIVDWMNSIILTVEGDDHTRLRCLVSHAFTPRAVGALRPMMRQVVNELIDRFVGEGRTEFMASFADPYPARVICELLGVPPAQHEAFRGWANDLGLAFSYAAAANRDRIEAALHGLSAATETLIAARRAEPGSDLLSALINAESGGDRLSAEELRMMVTTILFAGQDTTRHQLGHAIALFLRHPEQWALLARRPELAVTAVEEVLRVVPTVPATARVASEDFEVDGLAIAAGTVLTMLLAAGNTDPAAFGPDAAAFDITATRGPQQLGFGAGIHYCLGAALARTELAEALPILARRLGRIEADGKVGWRPALGITGPVTLPIRFRGRVEHR